MAHRPFGDRGDFLRLRLDSGRVTTRMNHLFAISLLVMGGCSKRAVYPTMGAAVGAGAGAAAGQLLAGDEDLKAAKAQTQQVIASLSKGDVEGMLAAAAGKQKGFVDEAIDGVIGFVKLCLIFLVLWNLIPIIYTRYVHRKHSNGNPKKT